MRDLTANGQGTLSQVLAGHSRRREWHCSTRPVGRRDARADRRLSHGQLSARGDAQRGFVDISSIPFVAVDRIEVLLDGASAIYGSDAIAGVVNIILKKDFKGTNVNATGGTTTKGGGTTWNAQIMQGFGDVGAGLGGYVALEYRRTRRDHADQRPGERWNSDGLHRLGREQPEPRRRERQRCQPGRAERALSPETGRFGQRPILSRSSNSNCNLAARNANQCQYNNDWGQFSRTRKTST